MTAKSAFHAHGGLVLRGRRSTEDETLALRASGILDDAPWLIECFRDFPLVGTEIILPEDMDDSTLGVDMRVLAPGKIIEEATALEPGKTVASNGLIPFAECMLGSGDPYFLQVRDDRSDAVVMRVPHDDPSDIEVVASSIEELLRRCVNVLVSPAGMEGRTVICRSHPVSGLSVVLEDDGHVGWLYLRRSGPSAIIADVWCYNTGVAAVDAKIRRKLDRPPQAPASAVIGDGVLDRPGERDWTVEWNDEGTAAVLRMDGVAHAAVSVASRRGECAWIAEDSGWGNRLSGVA